MGDRGRFSVSFMDKNVENGDGFPFFTGELRRERSRSKETENRPLSLPCLPLNSYF